MAPYTSRILLHGSHCQTMLQLGENPGAGHALYVASSSNARKCVMSVTFLLASYMHAYEDSTHATHQSQKHPVLLAHNTFCDDVLLHNTIYTMGNSWLWAHHLCPSNATQVPLSVWEQGGQVGQVNFGANDKQFCGTYHIKSNGWDHEEFNVFFISRG